jgi:outer membrane protein assembly factor BamA
MTTFVSIVAQIVVGLLQVDGVPLSRSIQNIVQRVVVSRSPNLKPIQKSHALKPGAIRIGEIKISGNTVTCDHVILGAIGIYPGQVYFEADLRAAENNLIKLGIFEVDPAKSIKPTVQVIDPDGPGKVKDVLVIVQEKYTTSLKPMIALVPGMGPGLALVFEELNWDCSRWPTCLDDFLSGRSFRGANQKLRAGIVFGPTLQPRVLFSLQSPSAAR